MNSSMHTPAKIYVAGHRGLVGSALVRELQQRGYGNILTRTHGQLDLTDQSAVRSFFERERPAYVFLAAAKVGGILANNTYPAEFIYQNLAVELNVIHSAWETGVHRLLFLGSSCIYPRDCSQPMREEYLLTGTLESTNRPYAVAKIAGIEACSAYNRQYGTRYLAVMPTNLYGPGDTYDLENSHVLPALIMKMHEAKVQGKPNVIVWGTGTPRREFLYSDDLANACVFLMELAEEPYRVLLQQGGAPIVNVGCGEDLTILELAHEVATVVGYRGELTFDTSKPDGTPRKLLDISRLRALGWSARVSLRSGLESAYQDFLVRNAVG
jgi:GDP-L-fucose synthase